MKRCLLMVIALVLMLTALPAAAQVERHPELDAAFSMLEEGNPILTRYNEITGADIKARYKYGMPYMFGGKDEDNLMKVKKCLETTKFFRKGKTYVYGFDCSGFTNWINKQVGKPEHDSLQNMILQKGKYGEKNHLPVKDLPFDELPKHLQVGDFLVGKHSARHIMMFIGTLADYGYTAENAPELADYLDYPIVVNSGKNPFYGERYEKYIKENGLKCNTTNGGVCIYIVGVPTDKAPHSVPSGKETLYYFDLGDYMLTIYDIFTCNSYVWFRM
jgi:hypothetical protein